MLLKCQLVSYLHGRGQEFESPRAYHIRKGLAPAKPFDFWPSRTVLALRGRRCGVHTESLSLPPGEGPDPHNQACSVYVVALQV